MEYNIGDKVTHMLHPGSILEIIGLNFSGDEDCLTVKILKWPPTPLPAVGNIEWFKKKNLKLFPQPLKKGQEIWVKAEYIENSTPVWIDAPSAFVGLKRPSGAYTTQHVPMNEILIKNEEGQIVPYNEN